jgi:hypothetical protein
MRALESSCRRQNRREPPLITGQQPRSTGIMGSVGKGGIGEVYQARDSKLNRDFRVMPEAVGQSPCSSATSLQLTGARPQTSDSDEPDPDSSRSTD